MKKQPVFVTKSNIPCVLSSPADRIGTFINSSARILLPVPGAAPSIFKGRKSAESAINRSTKLASKLKGTLLDDYPRFQGLFASGEFQIKPYVP